jgi:acetyl esterase/lipase
MVLAFIPIAMGILLASPAQLFAGSGRQLPPVTAFFGIESNEVFRLSPSGSRVAFLRESKKVSSLCVRQPNGLADFTVLTEPSHGSVYSFLWLDDCTLLFSSRLAQGGGVVGCVVFAPEYQSKAWVNVLVSANESGSLEGFCLDEHGDHVAVISFPSKRNEIIREYFQIHPRSGERRLIYENHDRLSLCVFSRDGRRICGTRFSEAGECELLALEADPVSARVMLRSSPGEVLHVLGMDFLGREIYTQTNVGAGVDLVRIEAVEWSSGRRRILAEDPKQEADIVQPVFSRTLDRLLGASVVRDRVEYHWTESGAGEIVSRIQRLIGNADLQVRDVSEGGKCWIVSAVRDRKPEDEFFYSVDRDELVKLSSRSETIPSAQLGEMVPVSFHARDGQQLRGYLTFPPDAEKLNLPVVVFPHGGPHMRNTWGFDPRVQFLASRGYAVFQINFRGSTGFGKAFQRAGYRQWGKGVLQDDLSDGVDWLIRTGIADPKRIAIVGGSYGGFAAIAGLTFTPERYAAGISLFGPSNLPAFIKTIPPGWIPFKHDLITKMGDPNDPSNLQILEAQSPLHAVGSIVAPLMVFQGAQDLIVRKEQADDLVSVCRAAGKRVEYFVSPEGGHGFTDSLDEQAVYVAIEHFLARYLGGESDPEVPPEIGARLDMLRQ